MNKIPSGSAIGILGTILSDVCLHPFLKAEVKGSADDAFLLTVRATIQTGEYSDLCRIVTIMIDDHSCAVRNFGVGDVQLDLSQPRHGAIAAQIYELLDANVELSRVSMMLATHYDSCAKATVVVAMRKSVRAESGKEVGYIEVANGGDTIDITTRNGKSLDLWYSRRSPRMTTVSGSVAFSQPDWFEDLVSKLNKLFASD